VGNQAYRVATLPIRIYIPRVMFSDGTDGEEAINKALEVWNDAARDVGQQRFFTRVDNPIDADLRVYGESLPPPALGAAVMAHGEDGSCFGVKIVMANNAPFQSAAQFCEVLAQECGHMLGLEHSNVPEDLMAPNAHRDSHPLSSIALTQRDRDALRWLYSQDCYGPIQWSTAFGW